MKRVARDFTVTMEVPNDTPISQCEIIIKVDTATRLMLKKGFAGRTVAVNRAGTNVQINFGEYYVESKHV